MKNIIIIGANGFTGRQILNDLSSKAQYKVTGCSLHPDILPKNGGNYHFITTDIRDEAAVKQLFKEVQPDVVINCSALSVPDYCETHHEEAWLTNVTAVEQLAHLCESYKSRFIHLSTDFVFDGTRSPDSFIQKKVSPLLSTITVSPNGKEKRKWLKSVVTMPLPA